MSDRTFLAATTNGLARIRHSSHEAETFERDYQLQTETVNALATGPPGSDLVVAGTTRSGIYRSDDRGATWDRLGLDEASVTALAVAPAETDIVYAGVRPPGVFRSTDGGSTWTACDGFQDIRGRRMWRAPGAGTMSACVRALAVSPVDPAVVVAGIEAGAVVRSTNGGATWSNHLGQAIRDCRSLVWHHTDPSSLYEAGSGERRRAAARSTDAGRTWERPGNGLDRGYGHDVAAHPGDHTTWYVAAATEPETARHGNGDGAVFRRRGDQSWTRLTDIPGSATPTALCTDPATPDAVWIGLADGTICHSPDQGDEWDAYDATLPGIERTLVLLT